MISSKNIVAILALIFIMLAIQLFAGKKVRDRGLPYPVDHNAANVLHKMYIVVTAGVQPANTFSGRINK